MLKEADYNKLETLLKHKKNSFSKEIKEKFLKEEFELELIILEYLMQKIKKFKFNTTYQNNSYLLKIFPFFKRNFDFTLEQNNIIITTIINIQNEILTKLENRTCKNDDLNYKLLLSINHELEQIIILFKSDFNKNKTRDNNEELYKLLEYVVLKGNNIEIFNELMRNFNFDNLLKNKEIVLKALDKYFNFLCNNDKCNQNYYYEILGEFFKREKNYLKETDINEIINKINIFLEKNLELLNSKYDLKKLRKQIENLGKNITRKNKFSDFKTKYYIDHNFPYDYDEEIANLNEINDDEFLDLTTKKLLTIDAKETKIKENIFSCDITNDGYLLTLYVPAITSLIKSSSQMASLAFEKGISVLKSDLFPRKFLYENCSFNENVNRYAFAYEFYLNNDFSLKNIEAKKVLVNVDINLTKEEALENLKSYDNNWVIGQLNLLSSFSTILANRTENTDAYFIAKTINNNLHYRMNREDDVISRNIIDNLTVYVNHQMANHFYLNKIPFVFRNNEFKNNEELFSKLKTENFEELKIILQKLKVDSYFSSKNIGHSGLNKNAYSQISTPCRNYASFECQKLIEKFLINKEKLDECEITKLKRKIENICKHLNERYKINESYLHEKKYIRSLK